MRMLRVLLGERGVLPGEIERHGMQVVGLAFAQHAKLAPERPAWGTLAPFKLFSGMEVLLPHIEALTMPLRSLPQEALGHPDVLGFAYQGLRLGARDEAFRPGRKVGRDELVAVTQLHTEPFMADALVWGALEDHGSVARLIDPACGAGVLLWRGLEALLEKQNTVTESRVMDALGGVVGLDIDPISVDVTNFLMATRVAAHLASPLRVVPDAGHVFDAAMIDGLAVPSSLMPHAQSLGSLLVPSVGSAGPAAMLLRAQYDAVVCNPPYAGFRRMDPALVRAIRTCVPRAQMDLYVAFIDRCMDFLAPGGDLALVAPSSWLTSERTRAIQTRALERWPRAVLSLGQRAFEDAPLLFVSLFFLRNESRLDEGGGAKTAFVRLQGKATRQSLIEAAGAMEYTSTLQLRSTGDLSGEPALVSLSAKGPVFGDYFVTRDGIWDGNNARDVCDLATANEEQIHRGVPLSAGHGYARWFAAHHKLWIGRSDVADAALRGQGGWEYARVAGRRLSARRVEPGTVALAGIVTLRLRDGVPLEHRGAILAAAGAVMNARIGTALLRSMVTGLNFNPGYCQRLPLPKAIEDGGPQVKELQRLVERCVALRKVVSANINEVCDRASLLEHMAALLDVEGAVDSLIDDLLAVPASVRARIREQLGPIAVERPMRPESAFSLVPPRTPKGLLPAQTELELWCQRLDAHPASVRPWLMRHG